MRKYKIILVNSTVTFKAFLHDTGELEVIGTYLKPFVWWDKLLLNSNNVLSFMNDKSIRRFEIEEL